MGTPKISALRQPVEVLGAGDLLSNLHRGEDADDPANYRFSICRLGCELESMHELCSCDLRDLVKLCQVLAQAIAYDGWVSKYARQELIDLADELDELTQRWSKSTDG